MCASGMETYHFAGVATCTTLSLKCQYCEYCRYSKSEPDPWPGEEEMPERTEALVEPGEIKFAEMRSIGICSSRVQYRFEFGMAWFTSERAWSPSDRAKLREAEQDDDIITSATGRIATIPARPIPA